jgi:hypothetical protein
VDVATGAMTTSFGAAAGSGSALSPDGTSVLLITDVSHESIEYGTGIIYHGTPLPGTGLISLAPAVWSPDGSSIVYTLGQGMVRGRAGSELAVAPASQPGTLGAPIRNAGGPSWQPLPGF